MQEIAELFEEGLKDEEIADDIKIDVKVVKGLREKFSETDEYENNPFKIFYKKGKK
ncbi:hypothetical protein [Thermovenabulum gondwanense]|uniref:HTH luxR-type domain-containing protein n=1 Tax=Thermovenabulum gondwanense TaxID=520767 RepID=A0A162M4I2_9FIRM|nr:hypothetical protein [Thermovenabulum gondwanense]KYO63961.1 hypothetical protein ATZ99_22040 [Thermovenabulum gondwanense]